jgi:ketosteroid isomerase-like protein
MISVAWRVFATVVASIALAACRPTPRAVDATDAVSDVRIALSASAVASNRGDLEAHIGIYADSAILFPPGPQLGRAQARSNFASYFAAGIRRPVLRLHSLRVDALTPESVLATGQWVLDEATGRGSRRGWFTELWRRTPQGWRIVHQQAQ